jgi:WD40 repeat protein
MYRNSLFENLPAVVPPPVHQVWDIRSKKVKEDLPGHADEVFAVDWSPDGGSVASGGRDKVLKVWRS